MYIIANHYYPPSQRLTATAFPKLGDVDTLAPSDGHASTNYKFPCYAQQVLRHSWAVYSFGGGHFASTISSRSLTFCVKLVIVIVIVIVIITPP
jgi:hypothetical protein